MILDSQSDTSTKWLLSVLKHNLHPSSSCHLSKSSKPAMRYNLTSVSWVCSKASSRWDMPRTPHLWGTCHHSGQMPELPQLAPFNVGERQLYSELLPNGQAPHLIPNVELGHPSEEAHWSCWIKTPLEFSEEVWILGFKLLCQIRSFSCFSLPRTCDHRWELGCCTLVNLRSLTWDIPNSHY